MISHSPLPFPPRRRGFALVLVLGCLVFLSALVLAFFSTVTTELQVSKTYASGTEVKLLSETVVNVVMAQISEATTTEGGTVAWASQPGAIRTFDENGSPRRTYKLYSANSMIANGGLAPTTDSAPASWRDNPALYTDLNEPQDDVNGDPNYPILYPPTNGNPIVGYNIIGDPGLNPGGFTEPVMPVSWLYVLQDGQLVAPTPAGTKGVNIDGASEANPIVGRVAFWADDETCKINVNTAAGDLWDDTAHFGSYWDTPLFASQQEFDLADYQPTRMEYQRYPGHPATVYLSAAFPNLTRDQLYSLVPRIENGGSEGGTIRNTDEKGWTSTAISDAPLTLDTDRLYASVDELLFADEVADNKRVDHVTGANPILTRQELEEAKFFITATSRAPEVNLFGLPRIAMWPIHTDYAGNDKSPYTTPFDRIIAFCSTLGDNDYYFIQRQDALSPTFDAQITRNTQLYAYLQELTGRGVPGFGGNFSDKYPSDRDQILTEMVDYIRSTNIFDDFLIQQIRSQYPWSPGTYPTDKFGKYTYTRERTGKYTLGPGHGYIVPLEIGDTRGMGRAYTISEAGFIFICTGKGDLVNFGGGDADDPSDGDNDNKPDWLKPWTVPAGQTGTDPVTGDPINGKNATLDVQLQENQRRIQAMFVMEINTPSLGYPHMVPDVKIVVEGLDKFQIDGQPLGFPDGSDTTNPTGTNYATVLDEAGSAGFHNRRMGGAMGIRGMLAAPYGPDGLGGRLSPARAPMPEDKGVENQGIDSHNVYPLVSNYVTVTLGDTDDTVNANETMAFSSTSGDGLVTVKIYADDNLVQTLELSFPNADFPVPQLIKAAAGNADRPASHWTFTNDGMDGAPGRLYWVNKNPDSNGPIIDRDKDVVRTVVPWHGDIRLLMGKSLVSKMPMPSSGFFPEWKGFVTEYEFVPHPYYFDETKRQAHNMINPATGAKAYNASSTQFGKLVSGAAYDEKKQPDVVRNVEDNTSILITRDWDNGMAGMRDGAYVNMPDAGTQHRNKPNEAPYFSDSQDQISPGATFFSPNRLVASAGYFGSLPSGVKSGTPFQTLLFRPQTNHPAHSTSIPDHLLMDLFMMPIVEPYAISEPFSTAGKINMNYQLVPFTHIERSTALQAAMRSERVAAIPTNDVDEYKNGLNDGSQYRRRINAGSSDPSDGTNFTQGTLSQFMDRFDGAPYAFKSATEICDIHLIPENVSVSPSGMATYWTNHALTGDNARERPYARLYQKLTTKSNTYTVHYRVQTLQQPKFAEPGEWTEGTGRVLGEYRGSTTVERFVDPRDPDLPDFATASVGAGSDPETLDDFYRFRIVGTKQFNP